MTLPELSLAIESVKVGVSILKSFNNLKSEYDKKVATSELLDVIINTQNNLFAIQSSYQSQLEEKIKVETDLEKLRQWGEDKLNYKLKQISTGCYVYVLKESQNSPDDQYWLCQPCFDNKNQKSIIQKVYASSEKYICNGCGQKFIIDEPPTSSFVNIRR